MTEPIMPKLRPSELRLIRALASGHMLTSAAASLGIGYETAKNEMTMARDRNRMNTYELIARVAVADFAAGVSQ